MSPDTETLAIHAFQLAWPPKGTPPAGEHELRIAVEGAAGEYRFQFGAHGRLIVGRKQRPLVESLTRALALALAAVPPARRAALARSLTSLGEREGVSPPVLKPAERIVRTLARQTGVTWKATPSYKPRV